MNTREKVASSEKHVATHSAPNVTVGTNAETASIRSPGHEQISGHTPPSKSLILRVPKAIVVFLLKQWLVIGLGIACALAACFPNVAAHGGVLKSEYSILYGVVAIIFLISGMQITRDKLVSHLTSWRLHLYVQGISFLLIPGIILAIIRTIIAVGGVSNPNIDISVLVGLIALASIPTTISSNVVLTRNSGGDDAAAMVEVMIGNILGPFITPGLCYALLPKDGPWEGWLPVASSGLGDMYRSVFQQIGLSVLVPLAAGQTLQWLFPERVKSLVALFHLPKVSTACLILLVWSTFSSSFSSGALYKVPHATVIMDLFLNLGCYVLFTVICFLFCRPPAFVRRITAPLDTWINRLLPPKLKGFQLLRMVSKEETIAVCFCGAAKTTGLGVPMVAAIWMNKDQLTINLIQIPVVLYTTEQIFLGQAMVWAFKRWQEKGEKGVDEESREEQNVVII